MTAAVGAVDARAQTAPAAASQDLKWFVDVNGGATFGTKSGSSVDGRKSKVW